MSKVCFFFSQTIGNICKNYPVLFEGGDNENGYTEGEEEFNNTEYRENTFTAFGIIPIVLKYCEVTNERLTDVMKESVNLVFYIVTFEILKAKEQERQLKNIRDKGVRN